MRFRANEDGAREREREQDKGKKRGERVIGNDLRGQRSANAVTGRGRNVYKLILIQSTRTSATKNLEEVRSVRLQLGSATGRKRRIYTAQEDHGSR